MNNGDAEKDQQLLESCTSCVSSGSTASAGPFFNGVYEEDHLRSDEEEAELRSRMYRSYNSYIRISAIFRETQTTFLSVTLK